MYCYYDHCKYSSFVELDPVIVSETVTFVYNLTATDNNNQSVTEAIGPGSVTETNNGPQVSHEITTFSEQSALSDMVVSNTMPDYDMNPYSDDTLYGFLERPRIVNTTIWNDTFAAGEPLVKLDPYFELLTSTPFRRKLENFQYFKAGLRIGVRTNGTPFHYGKLLIVWRPFAGSQFASEQYMRDNVFSASGYPNVIVSPTENEVNEMVVPFAYNTAYMDLSQDVVRSPGQLFIYVLNPLALDADVPPVSITVFANFENVKLAGQSGIVNLPLFTQQFLETDPNPFNVVTTSAVVPFEAQGDITIEARNKSREGLISGPAKAISSVAGALVNIPGIGIWAAAISTVSGALGKVAEHLGYCKPNTLQAISPFLQKNGDFAAGEGLDSAMKTQIIPDQSVTDIPQILGGSPGEMQILEMAGTPTLLGMFKWDGNDLTDSRLYTAPVNPRACTSVNFPLSVRVCPTLLSWVSHPFKYWRGSLRYDVQITCSNFHSGRLRVLFQPKNSGIVSGFDYQNTINRIVDIQTETDFSFTVPYISDKPWSYINSGSIEDTTGFIEFSVVNDLTHTSLPVPEVYVNVWVSAGPDFQLAMPYRDTRRDFGPIPTPVNADAADDEEEDKEDEKDDTPQDFEAQGLTSEVMKNRDHPPLMPDATGAVEHNICMVDTVTHLKQLTNRPAQFGTIIFDVNAENETRVDVRRIDDANVTSRADYFSWFGAIFVFGRGSTNIRMVPRYRDDVTQYWMWMGTSFAINGFNQQTRNNTLYEGWGQQLFTTLATPSKEINVPFYSPAFARIMGVNDGQFSSCFRAQLAKPTAISATPAYDIYRSTGDDWSFNYRVGPPSYWRDRPGTRLNRDVVDIIPRPPVTRTVSGI